MPERQHPTDRIRKAATQGGDRRVLDKVLQQAADDLPHHIERLQRYIRQPSISATRTGIDDMAAMLAAEIDRLGGAGRVIASPEFPIVYGRFDVGAERTVLIHGMYDVTPADEADWVVPPFSAARMALGDLGECIVGRGAEDTKGPLSSVLSMLASFRRAEVPLPANVILVFEGLGTRQRRPSGFRRTASIRVAGRRRILALAYAAVRRKRESFGSESKGWLH